MSLLIEETHKIRIWDTLLTRSFHKESHVGCSPKAFPVTVGAGHLLIYSTALLKHMPSWPQGLVTGSPLSGAVSWDPPNAHNLFTRKQHIYSLAWASIRLYGTLGSEEGSRGRRAIPPPFPSLGMERIPTALPLPWQMQWELRLLFQSILTPDHTHLYISSL